MSNIYWICQSPVDRYLVICIVYCVEHNNYYGLKSISHVENFSFSMPVSDCCFLTWPPPSCPVCVCVFLCIDLVLRKCVVLSHMVSWGKQKWGFSIKRYFIYFLVFFPKEFSELYLKILLLIFIKVKFLINSVFDVIKYLYLEAWLHFIHLLILQLSLCIPRILTQSLITLPSIPPP